MRSKELTDVMELHFTPTNGPADEAIDRLMTMVGGIEQPELVRELILAALKAGQEIDEYLFERDAFYRQNFRTISPYSQSIRIRVGPNSA